MGKLSSSRVPQNQPRPIRLHVVGGESSGGPIPFQHASVEVDGRSVYYFPADPFIQAMEEKELIVTLSEAIRRGSLKTERLKPAQRKFLTACASEDGKFTLLPDKAGANFRSFVLATEPMGPALAPSQ